MLALIENTEWNLTLIIALAGLVLSSYSTLLVPLYKRLFHRAELRIHPYRRAHVLFGPFGPGLRILGSIQGVNADTFLTSLEAIAEHQTTQEKRQFSWRILFPNEDRQRGDSRVGTDLPLGTMINTRQAFRFDTFFCVTEIEDGPIREIQGQLRKEWMEQWLVLVAQMSHGTDAQPEANITDMEALRQEAAGKVMKKESFKKAVERLSETLFWSPGDYRLTIQARTTDRDRPFEVHRNFKLSENDVQSLQFNTYPALLELTGVKGIENSYTGCTVDLI